MTSTPTPPKVRLTISVTPEVHETFQRFAKAANMSISRAMGEWLADTIEPAEFLTLKMEQARAAPKVVLREMHAYALGLVDESEALMVKIQKDGREARSASEAKPPRSGSIPIPPSGNTGGKGTRSTTRKTGGKS